MKTQRLTERQLEYLNAPRAIKGDVSFPTVGYYFVRGIRKKTDTDGKECLFAAVNWRLNEDEAWQDTINGNSFWLNLDYLFTPNSLGPNIAPEELLHQFIYVKEAKVRNSQHSNLQTRTYTDWDVIDYSNNLLEALPYSNMLSRYILAWEDEKLDGDLVDELANSLNDDYDDIDTDGDSQDDVIDL